MPRALALLVAVAATGCSSASYVLRQGIGQFQLLRARRPIADVLRDPAVDAHTKDRLRLAVEARDFGVRVLGLHGGDAYTRFLDTHGAPVAWNVSAAPRDRLVPHLNRFPIVGTVPYLGFFDERDARAAAAALDQRGLDTWVREVSGYSTLGFTSDPIYSSMLEGSDAAVVEVVLHEMLHGTVYLPGRSDWDESLATFVGLHGAALFFAARGDAASARALAEDASRREREQAEFARWLEPLVHDLEALYASPISRDEKLRRREAIFTAAQSDYRKRFPAPPGKPDGYYARTHLNNAIIVGTAIYHGKNRELDRLFERCGRDLPTMIRLCRRAVENEPDPVEWLRRR